MTGIIDIHPHIISDDQTRYPRKPLFGIPSTWSQSRPVTIEQMISAMDAAGVQKAAIVHASTCYGFDCSYLVDSIRRYPGRFTGVGSIDMLAPDADRTIASWIDQGLAGFRIFTGGSTKAVDASNLDDPRSYPAWEVLNERALSMCIQTNLEGIGASLSLARRFPRVKVVIDHLAQPNLSDGPPYAAARDLFAMADTPNIYMKVSTNGLAVRSRQGKATPETFYRKLVDVFGARRIAWGSNFPASEGSLTELTQLARDSLQGLTDDERSWVFARTAQHIYPSLKDG